VNKAFKSATENSKKKKKNKKMLSKKNKKIQKTIIEIENENKFIFSISIIELKESKVNQLTTSFRVCRRLPSQNKTFTNIIVNEKRHNNNKVRSIVLPNNRYQYWMDCRQWHSHRRPLAAYWSTKTLS
jgi:hypothetical protein